MIDQPHETSPLLLEVAFPSDIIVSASSKEQFNQQHNLPFLQQIKWEIQKQACIAFPTLQSMVITKIPWLISLRFVGGIGAEELAAAALATTLCNVTGYSISVGLSSALSTLSAQAKGELTSRMTTKRNKDYEVSSDEERHPNEDKPILPLVFLYRGMLVQLLFVVPIGIWWICGIKDFLISVGQTETLAAMAEKYLRVLAPGLLCSSVNWTLTAWVQSIGMADVPAYAAGWGLLFHIPFNLFFIHTVGLGYLGAAVATVCCYMIQVIFVITYLFVLPKGRHRVLDATGASAIDRTTLSFWNEFRIAAFSVKGIAQYLTLALPGIVIISEWWASEIAIFLSGHLKPFPESALAGMSIYQSINSFCFMFPVSFAVAGSARIGNLLGAGDPLGAKTAAQVSVLFAALASATCGCLLYFTPHTFLPSLFAPDEPDVILETSRTIPLLSTYLFADGLQAAFNGIIKGCGRQFIVMPIVVIAYWVVGLPLSYYFAFVQNDGTMECNDRSYFCGDVGLVAGLTIGTWVHMIMLSLVVVFFTNWTNEARLAKARVAEKQ